MLDTMMPKEVAMVTAYLANSCNASLAADETGYHRSTVQKTYDRYKALVDFIIADAFAMRFAN